MSFLTLRNASEEQKLNTHSDSHNNTRGVTGKKLQTNRKKWTRIDEGPFPGMGASEGNGQNKDKTKQKNTIHNKAKLIHS